MWRRNTSVANPPSCSYLILFFRGFMLIPADKGLMGFEVPVPVLLTRNQSSCIHCFFELLLLTTCFLIARCKTDR